jgi:4-amino-4-deoxy-L-arabinose transferase-like glycosyltransferase
MASDLRALLADRLFLLTLVGAFLIRLLYNLALNPGGRGPANFVIDEAEYFGAAHVLVGGRGFSFFDTALWVRPPLYVLFLGAAIRSFGLNSLPLLVVQCALSALTLLPLGWIAARIDGLRAARWAAALGALYLPFTLFAGLLLSETLFIFLFAGALAALLRAREALGEETARAALGRSALAGLMLGLAVLTRSTALGFVPLAALWLVYPSWRKPIARSRLAAVGVTVWVCALIILPWTLRNYAAYNRLVIVDTTSGYNLWLGSVGVRDEERLRADLATIGNPVDRQAYAYERAWENIRSDLAAFVAKGLKESLDLWRPLFSAEERQVSGYSLGRVPAWHLLSLVIFDDLLFLGILLLAGVGLVLGPAHPARSLTLLWVALWVLMSFVFFAVTRFRLPVVAALLPWAGVGIGVLVSSPNALWKASRGRKLGLVALYVAVLLVVLPVWPFLLNATRLGVARWGEQAPYRQAEALLAIGNAEAAEGTYRRANQELADTRYGLAAALLQQGRTDEALQQLREDEPPDRFEPFIIGGEAARLSGDRAVARTLFNMRVVSVAGDRALRWAWDHLDPPEVDTLDIGGGLDIGYIRGFHGAEVDAEGVAYRWTLGEAEVRNVRPSPSGVLNLTWSSWRPDSVAAAVIELRGSRGADNLPGSAITLNRDPDFEETSLSLPGETGGETYLRIEVNPFVASGADPRLLGVRLAKVGAGE